MTSMQTDEPTSSNTIDLYVVQRCWFSGPKTFAPVEYARLFPTATDAESLAYQSAHAFAQQHQQPVRTLQLQSGGNSYGFVAAGSLFWIRPVEALVVVGSDDNLGPSTRTKGAHALLAFNQHTLWSPAGTNARRINTQTTQHPPTVFVGSSSTADAAAAAAAASQACAQQFALSAAAMQQRQQQQVRVVWLPIGPSEVDSWWKEWPDQCLSESVLQQQQQTQDTSKRGNCGDATTATTNQHGSDVDNEDRPAKRRNRVEPSSTMAMKW